MTRTPLKRRSPKPTFGAIATILAAGILAGCAGCASPEAPAPIEIPDEPEEIAPIVADPEPARPTDADGVWLDENGRPIARTVYFDFDQAVLKPRDLRVLERHAEFLRGNRSRTLTIEGHCDERGTREYNLALGERRANAVQDFLTSAGVRSSQLETVSYGEERPVDVGHDESAWSKNRRAELIYR